MQSHFDGLEDIQNRLVRLEKQNRRLRQLGAAVLIASASLIVMGQAPSKKIIEANEFILRDDSAKVRARIIMNPLGDPEMILFNERGKALVKLTGGLGGSPSNIGGIVSVFDGQGQERGVLSATDFQGGDLSLNFKDSSHTLLQPGEVTVSDEQGFQTTLGTQELVTLRTGEKERTSAASIAMFGKDKNVIWKAP